MNYVEQTIQVFTLNGKVPVSAMVGEGTGLAYHHWVNPDGKLDPQLLTITHVQSGFVLSGLCVSAIEEAQEWLERVSDLLPNKWQCDTATMKKLVSKDPIILKKVLDAHEAVTVDQYFLYAARNGSPYTESHTDAPSRNPDNEQVKAVVARLLKSYHHATEVVFTRMTPDGKHHDIKIYSREENTMNTCGSCKMEPCTCYEEKLAQEELLRAEALKDWERRNEEAVNYHNDELCQNEAHEFAHAHEIEDTPGVRAPRTLRPMQDRGKPRPPRRYYRA